MTSSALGLGAVLLLIALGCGEAENAAATNAGAWPRDPEWVDSCRRSCALFEALSARPCAPGEALVRGVPLGTEQPAEAPLSDDSACVEECLDADQAGYRCSEQARNDHDCAADGIWVCGLDGNYGLLGCSDADDPAVCGE